MTGYIGMALLLLANVVLVTKAERFFFPMSAVASAILTYHAFALTDVPFIVVNGFIAIMMTVKSVKIFFPRNPQLQDE